MKIVQRLGLLIALATCIHTSAFSESAAVDDDGFLPLFNGKDLEGWTIKGNPAGFVVEDGIIRSETGGGGHLMYYTDQEFSDFVLVVEWRVAPRGNSGVFIRADEDSMEPWSTNYEVQISSEDPPRDDSRCTASLYAYVAVDPRPDETPEQWRTFQITCKGENIQVEIDGVQVIDFDQSTLPDTKDKALSGLIGLQDSHGPEGTWIEYRTVKIKPLED